MPNGQWSWRTEPRFQHPGFELSDEADDGEPPWYAFLGVRPCDLRAIAIQDRVLAQPGAVRGAPRPAAHPRGELYRTAGPGGHRLNRAGGSQRRVSGFVQLFRR